LSQKSYFLDAAVSDSQGQLQNIAAGWVLDLGRSVWVRHLAGVARVLKVIEDLGRVHRRKIVA
jgi:hypothetical protein